MADFQVQGLEGVLAALRALPPEVAGKNGGPVRAALFQGAKIIREEAKRLAPRKTGKLVANVVMVRDRNPKQSGANERYQVGVRGKAFYGKFHEFGTVKMAAKPFLRPAFETKKQEALEKIVATLKTGIDKAAAKVAKR